MIINTVKKNVVDPNAKKLDQNNFVRHSLLEYFGNWGSYPDLCIAASGMGWIFEDPDIINMIQISTQSEAKIIYSSKLPAYSFYWLESKDMENPVDGTLTENLNNLQEIRVKKMLPCMSRHPIEQNMVIDGFLVKAYIEGK